MNLLELIATGGQLGGQKASKANGDEKAIQGDDGAFAFAMGLGPDGAEITFALPMNAKSQIGALDTAPPIAESVENSREIDPPIETGDISIYEHSETQLAIKSQPDVTKSPRSADPANTRSTNADAQPDGVSAEVSVTKPENVPVQPSTKHADVQMDAPMPAEAPKFIDDISKNVQSDAVTSAVLSAQYIMTAAAPVGMDANVPTPNSEKGFGMSLPVQHVTEDLLVTGSATSATPVQTYLVAAEGALSAMRQDAKVVPELTERDMRSATTPKGGDGSAIPTPVSSPGVVYPAIALTAQSTPQTPFQTAASRASVEQLPSELNTLREGATIGPSGVQPSVAPLAISPQLSGSAPVQQVLTQISVAEDKSPNGMIEVRLDPEELGKVRISFIAREGGMIVSVFAERPETLDLLRRHSDELQSGLNDMDFEGANLEFSQERPALSGETEDETDADLDLPLTQPKGITITAGVVSDDRLDIRL